MVCYNSTVSYRLTLAEQVHHSTRNAPRQWEYGKKKKKCETWIFFGTPAARWNFLIERPRKT